MEVRSDPRFGRCSRIEAGEEPIRCQINPCQIRSISQTTFYVGSYKEMVQPKPIKLMSSLFY